MSDATPATWGGTLRQFGSLVRADARALLTWVLLGTTVVSSVGWYRATHDAAPAPAPIRAPDKPLRVSLVYDDSAKTPQLAAVQASPTVAVNVRAIGDSVYRSFAKGDPTSVQSGIDSEATAFGLPCAIVQDRGGAVVGRIRITTEADLLAAVKAIAEGRRP